MHRWLRVEIAGWAPVKLQDGKLCSSVLSKIGIKLYDSPSLDSYISFVPIIIDLARLTIFGENSCCKQPSVFSCEAHFKPAACAQAGDTSVLPRIRQRGQQMNDTIVTLEQHFGNCRRRPKIAVNLKRRARVEQIRENSAAAIVSDACAERRT